VAKVRKNAVLPQWFAVSTEKKAKHVSFFGKMCQCSHGKALLPKSDKRQTIVATHLYKTELFELNSRQTFRAMAAMHTDESHWEQFLLSQIGMDRGKNSLIAQGSRGGLDVGDQLWSLFITALGEMYLVG
jgi:hypothetical protein